MRCSQEKLLLLQNAAVAIYDLDRYECNKLYFEA